MSHSLEATCLQVARPWVAQRDVSCVAQRRSHVSAYQSAICWQVDGDTCLPVIGPHVGQWHMTYVRHWRVMSAWYATWHLSKGHIIRHIDWYVIASSAWLVTISDVLPCGWDTSASMTRNGCHISIDATSMLWHASMPLVMMSSWCNWWYQLVGV